MTLNVLASNLIGRMGERTGEADVAVWARAGQQAKETRWTKSVDSEAAEGTRGSRKEPDRPPWQEKRIAHPQTPRTWTVNTRFCFFFFFFIIGLRSRLFPLFVHYMISHRSLLKTRRVVIHRGKNKTRRTICRVGIFFLFSFHWLRFILTLPPVSRAFLFKIYPPPSFSQSSNLIWESLSSPGALSRAIRLILKSQFARCSRCYVVVWKAARQKTRDEKQNHIFLRCNGTWVIAQQLPPSDPASIHQLFSLN